MDRHLKKFVKDNDLTIGEMGKIYGTILLHEIAVGTHNENAMESILNTKITDDMNFGEFKETCNDFYEMTKQYPSIANITGISRMAQTKYMKDMFVDVRQNTVYDKPVDTNKLKNILERAGEYRSKGINKKCKNYLETQ